MKRLAIFAAIGSAQKQIDSEYVLTMLDGVRPHVERLVVVTDLSRLSPLFDRVDAVADQIIRSGKDRVTPATAGYREAIRSLGRETVAEFDELLLFDSSNYGPVRSLGEVINQMAHDPCDFWSVNHFKPGMDKRLGDRFTMPVMPMMDFVVFRKRCLEDPEFFDFWDQAEHNGNYFKSFAEVDLTLFQRLADKGFHPGFLIDPDELKTAEPGITQTIDMLERGSPLVARNAFVLDPLVTEMQALDGRRVLTWLRQNTGYDTRLIWDSLIDKHPLRTIHTNLEEVRVIDDQPHDAGKTSWSFGKIAVFAHIFYAEMTQEFVERVMLIPGNPDFYATTSTEEHKAEIEVKVRELGFDGFLEVRVVEHNRGRTCPRLFITFRDVVLSDKYGLCLRLHSKRTPQMSFQIGASFKEHMFDNLVPSTGYVSRLFDLLETSANIGVVIPPTVHIGYGTLGHAWFANRRAFKRVAKDMGLTIPFDQNTPVAAYGTMYWFRPQALRRMFEYEWQWEDYNPEPHHVDGGLAHVQERLICYCAQQDKYRTLSVMNPSAAARNYVKLEYKHQLLASKFPSGDIRKMMRMPLATPGKELPRYSRARFFDWVARNYDKTKDRWPWFWRTTQPISKRWWPYMQKVIERSRA